MKTIQKSSHDNDIVDIFCASSGATHFAIIGRKLYVPVEKLSTQDNTILLQQIKVEFETNS